MRTLFSRLSLFSLLSLLILSGCRGESSTRSRPLSDRLQNPLFAEQYWSEKAEHMADFIRNEDPITKDAVKKAVIESERADAVAKLEEVRKSMSSGRKGALLIATEPIQGMALLLNNTLYFGSTFLAYPNPDTYVYLTTIVDPRDTTFPDATSYQVGPLQSPYGEQEYVIPESRSDPRFKTVVIYDKKLDRILGFAQL